MTVFGIKGFPVLAFVLQRTGGMRTQAQGCAG